MMLGASQKPKDVVRGVRYQEPHRADAGQY